MIADLHIHSRFSRACSKNINLDNLEKYARIKGLNLLGTGDFTHPEWLKEIKENLKEENGILYSKTGFKFILTGEISLMYTQRKGRRVHLVLLAPNLDAVDKINEYLDKKGRRDYDGRPIFKISCEQFVKDMREIDKKIEVIPAHIWTPWFGVFGSKSGFDSLNEAFGSEFDNVHAIETGMSSDPKMNWRISELNSKTIVSFSDSHSFWPWRLGREATIFQHADTYDAVLSQIRENKILGTIETDPGYGIYHYDGHRECNFSSSPEETKRLNSICPVCQKLLTIGVDSRVDELSNQLIEANKNQKKYLEMLPLHEVISLVYGTGIASVKCWKIYNSLIEKFKNEFNILIDVPESKFIENEIDGELIRYILLNREGKIKVKPGYDGVYGKALLEDKQATLF